MLGLSFRLNGPPCWRPRGVGQAVVEALTQARGALTLAGAGAVNVGQLSPTAPFTATSSTYTLSSGTAGHWTLPVDGSTPTPTAAGVTAGLNGGPYVFNFTAANDPRHHSGTLTINTRANTYTVATIAELAAVKSAAAFDGKTVEFAKSASNFATATYASPIDLSWTAATGTVFKPEDTTAATTLGPALVTGGSNLTFSYVKWAYDSATLYVKPHAIVTVASSTAINFSHCEVDGTSTLGKDYRYEGIRTSASTTTVDSSNVHHIRTGVIGSGTAGTVTVTNNTIHHFYEDGYSVDNHDATITGNEFYASEGRSGRRWVSTITGTIAAGEVLTNGLSGSAQKIIQVATAAEDSAGGGSGTPVTGTYVDGFYNNYAKPVPGETYTGASGSLVISSEDVTFDGIHGDAMQPLNNGASSDHTLNIKNNFIRRQNGYVFDALGEPNIQAIFIEDANATYGWGSVNIEGNICAGGQPNAIVLQGSTSATVINNTIIQTEANAGRSKIIISTSTYTAYGNLSDNGLGGVISDGGGNTATLTDYDGDNNGGVIMTSATQASNFSGVFAYPQAISQFTPLIGSPADTGKAGAKLTDGSWRPTAMETPPAASGLTILDTAATHNNTVSSNTVAAAGYTPPAGTNRRAIAVVTWHGTGGSALAATFGGVAMTQIAIRGSASTLSTSNEGVAVFALPEGSWPAGSSFTVSGTVTSSGTSTNMAITVFTLNGSPAAASATANAGVTANVNTTGISASITPTAAGSLVLAASVWSANQTAITYTNVAEADKYIYPASSRTLSIAEATQGTSALSVTEVGSTTGRAAMILVSFAP